MSAAQAQVCQRDLGFPKIRGTFLRVPIISTWVSMLGLPIFMETTLQFMVYGARSGMMMKIPRTMMRSGRGT